MEDLAEYIKHTRHFDGLGMGDQDLEQRAKKLQTRIEELEGAIRDHKLSTWSNLITDEDRVLWEILDDTRRREND